MSNISIIGMVAMMPHERQRHVLPQLIKRLGFVRVVAIQGPRQCGKSYLARELLSKALPAKKWSPHYITLDRKNIATFAQDSPGVFLDKSFEGTPLILDEAQKAPALFDEIKVRVDEDPQPGRFILLGSTEFNRLSRVRESLTGRMSRFRLYSMNLGEACAIGPNLQKTHSLLGRSPRISRKEWLRHLERGGLPGIFSVRTDAERNRLFEDWVSLTCERDIHQFRDVKADSVLTRTIFEQIARLEEPNLPNLVRTCRASPAKVRQHLELMKALFVIHELRPHPMGSGKPLYFACDSGLASFCGADFGRCLWTWALHEQLSQRSYRGEVPSTELQYYRTSKGSLVHLALTSPHGKHTTFIKIIDHERYDKRDYEVLKAIQKSWVKWPDKSPDATVEFFALGSSFMDLKKESIRVFSWEAMG